MESEKFRAFAACYLIVKKEGKLLLLRRFNTGWQDGMYAPPSGHIEEGETAQVAMAREAMEEVGIKIAPADLEIKYVALRKSPEREYVDFYLAADNWEGEPFNAEPNKSDEVGWFESSNLPGNTVDYVLEAINDIDAGKPFGNFGFGRE